MEEGYEKGTICNRDGCGGIIAEHDKQGGCSCHINPPCSYCETPREYCPECDWDANEEKRDAEIAYSNSITTEQREAWDKEMKEYSDRREAFYKLFYSAHPVEILEYRKESHSNSSMKVFGINPPNAEIDMEKIRGTFGGRFEYHNKETGRFIYIAYTD